MNMSYWTMCELKVAWYWPRFFFCVLRLRCSQNLLSHKKRTRPVSSHLGLTEHAFLILHKEHHFFVGHRAIWNGQDSCILAAQTANHNIMIWFILPTHKASCVITIVAVNSGNVCYIVTQLYASFRVVLNKVKQFPEHEG